MELLPTGECFILHLHVLRTATTHAEIAMDVAVCSNQNTLHGLPQTGSTQRPITMTVAVRGIKQC
jgi:hypothetical protein